MEQVKATEFEIGDERVAWEGLAASCTPPVRRLGAFMLVGFAYFAAVTTAVVLFYNIFGDTPVEGGGVAVPREAIYATIISSFGLALGGFNYTKREKVIDIGPIEATAERHERIPVSPIAGGLALAAGVVLLVAGNRKTS